jgi:hypothetical protein
LRQDRGRKQTPQRYKGESVVASHENLLKQ